MLSRSNRQLLGTAWAIGNSPWSESSGELIPCDSGDTTLESDQMWQETKTGDLTPAATPATDGLFEIIGGEILPL